VTLKTTPKFALFDPPVQIRGGVGEISLTKLYNPTSEIHLMAVHCVAAERGGLIKEASKKRKFMGKT